MSVPPDGPDGALLERFPRLRDVLAAAVYSSRGGLKATAADLDVSPSELSRMLSRDSAEPRKLDVDEVEKIIESTGDTRPVQWLIERFFRDPKRERALAAQRIANIATRLMVLSLEAGIVGAESVPAVQRSISAMQRSAETARRVAGGE